MSSSAPRAHTSTSHLTPITPPESQRAQLEHLYEQLKRLSNQDPTQPTCRLLSPTGEEVDLPRSVTQILEYIVGAFARGDSVTVVPVERELTTQQAANLLNFSRQYLVRLLDEGRLPHRRTGKHRRVRMNDVLAYKHQRDQRRSASLDALSQLTQDFGGYDELSTEG